MIILCTKCGHRFESLIINQELAYKEIFNDSIRHIKTQHSSLFHEMQKAVGISVSAMTTFMHFSEFVVVPEDETKIQETLEQCQEVVMAAIGFDPEEDEEDDETEEEGEELEDLPVISKPYKFAPLEHEETNRQPNSINQFTEAREKG